MLERMRRKENPLVLFVPSWWPSHCGKPSGDSTKKLKTEPPCDPTNPLLDIYPKKTKQNIREISALPCDCSFIQNSRDTEATCVHPMEYCSVMRRKKRILPFVTTWMDSELMLSELSQRRITSLLRTILKKKRKNLKKQSGMVISKGR